MTSTRLTKHGFYNQKNELREFSTCGDRDSGSTQEH